MLREYPADAKQDVLMFTQLLRQIGKRISTSLSVAVTEAEKLQSALELWRIMNT